MKFLKVSHKMAKLITAGQKNSTWRINDEKNLSVDDEIGIIDKVDPKDPSTWLVIGTGRISQVVQKHLKDIQNNDLEVGEQFASRTEMIKTFQHYYGRDINEQTTVKIVTFSFVPQDPQAAATIEDKNTTNLTEIKLYADGGSRGNPGPSASGYVLMTMDDAVVFEGGAYMGITTNNQAEYNALKLGLQEAANRGSQIVHVYMDSLLVINQMKGLYKIRSSELQPVNQSIVAMLHRFKQITFTHVPRELNKLADAMVNEVLDSANAQEVS